MKSGPKPRPHLQVVREGNPGKRPVKEGLKLPPGAPSEPRWTEWFPVTQGSRAPENQRARDDARSTWRLIVPVLDHQGVLAQVDLTVVADCCVTVARLRQAEREISTRGMAVLGERGWQKNPAVTAANQYRSQLRFYVAELGLSPSARTRLEGGGGGGDDDGDDPFDS